jgi:predicted dienelactone hydrolase
MDSTLRLLAFLLLLASGVASAANHELAINPISPGRFAVACSNVAMDAGAIAASGRTAEDFWEGRDGRYLTDILTERPTALSVEARIPLQFNLYPRYSGGRIDYAVIVCHPTPASNTDANYTLPGSNGAVPRMQPPGQAPKLISVDEYFTTLGVFLDPPPPGPAKLPLIVYSHGLAGSPISKGYIDVMTQLASQGFMVAAIFHGDPRFSSVKVEDLVDAFFAIAFFDFIVEMQALRPLSLAYMLDMLLAHPWWSQGIDTTRIGGFGASMGGQAMAHLMGARITSSITGGCRETVRDSRIRAAFTFVPYAGHSILPAFCRDQEGAAEVERPFFAMTGSFDTTAPESEMERALRRMRGSRYHVSLQGGQHELRLEDAGDLFTWMVGFYAAYLDLPMMSTAKGTFIKLAEVNGGRRDILRTDVHVPQASGGEPVAREFWNSQLNHYFMAAGQDEVDAILRGDAGPGWQLTGQGFKVYAQMPSDTFTDVGPVCRFYGGLNGGPNSHFFTASGSECELVKRNGGWFYEGIGFHIRPVSADGGCPFGMLQVQRAYNNRFAQNDSNHRFSTSDSTMREMRDQGWIPEGAVMCARF